jgi:tight adherence protein C
VVAIVLLWVLFTAGVFLALIGGRRPSLAERVQALRPETPIARPKREADTVFTLRWLAPLGAGFVAAGELLGRLRRRFGLDSAELTRRLALAGRAESLSVFFAAKILYTVLGLALPSVAEALRLHVPLPTVTSLGLAIAGYFAPNWLVTEQARARRLELEEGVVQAALAIASSLGAGSGIAEAVEEAGKGEGEFARELRAALAEAQLSGSGPADAVDAIGVRLGLAEARDLAASLRAAEQGAPLTETLLAQARTLSQRHRSDTEAAGQRAEIRIHLTVAAFVLPGLLLLMLYPAAHALTTFTSGG